MASLKRLARHWGRRFYLLLRPREVWRQFRYWNCTIPTPLVSRRLVPQQVWTSRLVRGQCVAHAAVDLMAARAILQRRSDPKVSCLMVTRQRYVFAQRAIACFRRQTYPNKELIIVDDDPDARLKRWTDALADPTIVHLRMPDAGHSLGALRNVSLQRASGGYIAQWDDDDLYHPDRLLWQMSALCGLDAEACFLHRMHMWMPSKNHLGVSGYHMVEGSMVCAKRLVPSYAHLGKGEDSQVCDVVVRSARTVLCDQPDAYVYVFHGGNTWDADHFARIARQCTHQYRGDRYAAKLRALESEYGVTLAATGTPPATPAQKPRARPVLQPDVPQLLVLTPVKNASAHIARFFEQLGATDYPKRQLAVALLESDSSDDTYAQLEAMLPALQQQYARVALYQHAFGYRTERPRWAPSVQLQRRTILAQSRNMLLSRALRDEQWVLWIDVDLMHWDAATFRCLLGANKSIVVPHCVRPNGETFDLNTFQLSADAATLDWERYVIDGILQPPRGYGRRYLNAFAHTEYVALDGVGGTMLLVRADLHRKGLIFPPVPYRRHIETEGLAQLARDMGHVCWGMPQLEVVHCDG